MDIEPVLQETDKGSEKSADHKADDNDERLRDCCRKSLIVTHKDRCHEAGHKHLACDTDVKESASVCKYKCQRRQKHRCHDVEEREEVRQHAVAGTVTRLSCKSVACQEAVKSCERILAQNQKEDTGDNEREDNRKDRDRDAVPFFMSEDFGQPCEEALF